MELKRTCVEPRFTDNNIFFVLQKIPESKSQWLISSGPTEMSFKAQFNFPFLVKAPKFWCHRLKCLETWPGWLF